MENQIMKIPPLTPIDDCQDCHNSVIYSDTEGLVFAHCTKENKSLPAHGKRPSVHPEYLIPKWCNLKKDGGSCQICCTSLNCMGENYSERLFECKKCGVRVIDLRDDVGRLVNLTESAATSLKSTT